MEPFYVSVFTWDWQPLLAQQVQFDPSLLPENPVAARLVIEERLRKVAKELAPKGFKHLHIIFTQGAVPTAAEARERHETKGPDTETWEDTPVPGVPTVAVYNKSPVL